MQVEHSPTNTTVPTTRAHIVFNPKALFSPYVTYILCSLVVALDYDRINCPVDLSLLKWEHVLFWILEYGIPILCGLDFFGKIQFSDSLRRRGIMGLITIWSVLAIISHFDNIPMHGFLLSRSISLYLVSTALTSYFIGVTEYDTIPFFLAFTWRFVIYIPWFIWDLYNAGLIYYVIGVALHRGISSRDFWNPENPLNRLVIPGCAIFLYFLYKNMYKTKDIKND